LWKPRTDKYESLKPQQSNPFTCRNLIPPNTHSNFFMFNPRRFLLLNFYDMLSYHSPYMPRISCPGKIDFKVMRVLNPPICKTQIPPSTDYVGSNPSVTNNKSFLASIIFLTSGPFQRTDSSIWSALGPLITRVQILQHVNAK
jgi:hypothetical protein